MGCPLSAPTPHDADPVLQVYLLGSVEFEAALALQRRLVYDVAGEPHSAALIVCEHPPLITVGRHGSWSHLQFGPQELRARRWRVRWVNRGGGCLLHLPGQYAVYPILNLTRLGLSVDQLAERTRIQGLTDALIWSSAAAASLSSGLVVAGAGYATLGLLGASLVIIPVLVVLARRRAVQAHVASA